MNAGIEEPTHPRIYSVKYLLVTSEISFWQSCWDPVDSLRLDGPHDRDVVQDATVLLNMLESIV